MSWKIKVDSEECPHRIKKECRILYADTLYFGIDYRCLEWNCPLKVR